MHRRLTVVLAASLLTVGVAVAAPTSSSALAGSSAGQFTPLPPTRILDSRNNIGLNGHMTQAQTRTLQVTGKGGVPSSGVSAVVFNLTVTNATSSSWITVWPTGQGRPAASNINFPKHWTGANLVTVAVGTGGQVNLYNSGGSVDVIGDVVGWYSDSSRGGVGNFQLAQTARVWDSRPGNSLPGNHVPLPGRSSLQVPVDAGSTANPHMKAAVVTITAVKPQSSGYFSAWSGVGSPPTASVLNYTAGSIVANLAIVPVSPCGQCPAPYTNVPSIGIYNGSNGSTNILVDVWGFYDDGALPDGLGFKPLAAPIRISDSTLGTGTTRHVLAPGTVAGAPTQLLVQNVTSVPSANTWLALYPHGITRPGVSNVNPAAHRTVAELAYTGVGTTNDFDVYNSNGSNRVLIDVAGSMEPAGSF